MNAPLPREVQIVLDLQTKWGIVGKAFQDCAPQCEECGFCKVTIENHPYGMGTAPETLVDCVLGERASDQPEQCPAYQAQLEETEE